MEKLDSYLQGYPAFLQKPLFTVLFIVAGYFIAKSLSAILAKLLHIPFPKIEETPTHGVYFLRLLFWGVWLIFIIAGLLKYSGVRGAFSNVYPKEENFWAYFVIFLGAAVLSMLSALLTFQIGETIKSFSKQNIFKNALLGKVLAWCAFWTVLVAAGTSLDAPTTVQEKIIASLLLLAFGWIVGVIVKEIVVNLLSIFDFTYVQKDIDLSLSINLFGWHRVQKLSAPKHTFFGYIAFMLFLFAVVKLWV